MDKNNNDKKKRWDAERVNITDYIYDNMVDYIWEKEQEGCEEWEEWEGSEEFVLPEYNYEPYNRINHIVTMWNSNNIEDRETAITYFKRWEIREFLQEKYVQKYGKVNCTLQIEDPEYIINDIIVRSYNENGGRI